MTIIRQNKHYRLGTMDKYFALAVVVVLTSSLAMADGSGSSAAGERSRPFRMGFTAFVHDFTPQAVEETRQFVRANADLIAHHIEGVPWTEALRGDPYSKELLGEYESKRSLKPPGAQVYLAVSPGRGDLKRPDKGAAPLAPELKGRPYDDPLVKKAYLAYCRRSMEFFTPDYLAIGIETNEILNAGADKWRAYVELHRHIYRELKKEHPNLPVFASFTLHNMRKNPQRMLGAWAELMPDNDFVAVSYYPFLLGEPPEKTLQWLAEKFDRFGKPVAFVETNDAAERLVFPQSKIVIDGSLEKQATHLRTLLALAERRRFEFIVLFIHRDYDALWDKIKATAPELFMAWRDCGLLDEQGNARPAYAIWREHFERPLCKGE